MRVFGVFLGADTTFLLAALLHGEPPNEVVGSKTCQQLLLPCEACLPLWAIKRQGRVPAGWSWSAASNSDSSYAWTFRTRQWLSALLCGSGVEPDSCDGGAAIAAPSPGLDAGVNSGKTVKESVSVATK